MIHYISFHVNKEYSINTIGILPKLGKLEYNPIYNANWKVWSGDPQDLYKLEKKEHSK